MEKYILSKSYYAMEAGHPFPKGATIERVGVDLFDISYIQVPKSRQGERYLAECRLEGFKWLQEKGYLEPIKE